MAEWGGEMWCLGGTRRADEGAQRREKEGKGIEPWPSGGRRGGRRGRWSGRGDGEKEG